MLEKVNHADVERKSLRQRKETSAWWAWLGMKGEKGELAVVNALPSIRESTQLQRCRCLMRGPPVHQAKLSKSKVGLVIAQPEPDFHLPSGQLIEQLDK